MVLTWEEGDAEADANERRKLYQDRKKLNQAFAQHDQTLSGLVEPYLRFTETR